MSDTMACSNCGTQVPAAAAFCTGCGQPMAAAAPPPPPPPPSDPTPAPTDAPDATQVVTPGLHDATQVTPPPPSAPAPSPYAPPAPPPPSTTGSGPWGPSTSEPPTAAPWTPPTAAPPASPAAPPPPAWQQPTPPPGPSAYPPAPGASGAAAWGAAPEPEATKATGGSVLGGLLGIIGAALALAGIFSGWVKLGDTGTVSAWSLTSGDGVIKTQTPYVILALAAAAVVVSLVLFTGIARTLTRITAALLGVAIIGVTAANWAEIASFVTDNFPSAFKANTAIGFYLTIAGGVLVIISALMPAKKKA
ncbi:MAG: zinc ribbon domain-containing protein [Aquihabitans sp.]